MAHQSAIEAVLTGMAVALNVTGLTSLCGLYNAVDATAPFPYTRIGEINETREDTFGKAGKSLVVRLHVFSQYPGDLEIARIVSKLIELLHYQVFTVANHTLTVCQYDQSYPAGTENVNGIETRHHIAEFRVVVQQVA